MGGGGVICAEETWIWVPSQPQSAPPHQHTHPGSPIFIALSPFFLLVWGFVATDSGSETNGFWFLGPEILPDKVVDGKYTAQSWALGGRRGRGGGEGRGASLLCLVLVHCGNLSLLPPDLAKPQPKPLHRPRWDGACGSLDTLDQFYRNSLALLRDAWVKRQHNSTRTLPRHTMFLAALATLSFMEPGGQKRDLLGLSATATWGHMLAPKGRQGYTLSSLAIPAFNLSPKPGPYGGGRPGDHLLRGLGADMGQGQAVAGV